MNIFDRKKLPIDHTLSEAGEIYAKRLILFLAVVAINLLIFFIFANSIVRNAFFVILATGVGIGLYRLLEAFSIRTDLRPIQRFVGIMAILATVGVWVIWVVRDARFAPSELPEELVNMPFLETDTPEPSVTPTSTRNPESSNTLEEPEATITRRPTNTPLPTIGPTNTPLPTMGPTNTPPPTIRPTNTLPPTTRPTNTPLPPDIIFSQDYRLEITFPSNRSSVPEFVLIEGTVWPSILYDDVHLNLIVITPEQRYFAFGEIILSSFDTWDGYVRIGVEGDDDVGEIFRVCALILDEPLTQFFMEEIEPLLIPSGSDCIAVERSF